MGGGGGMSKLRVAAATIEFRDRAGVLYHCELGESDVDVEPPIREVPGTALWQYTDQPTIVAVRGPLGKVGSFFMRCDARFDYVAAKREWSCSG